VIPTLTWSDDQEDALIELNDWTRYGGSSVFRLACTWTTPRRRSRVIAGMKRLNDQYLTTTHGPGH
jgi:hypothetical protein